MKHLFTAILAIIFLLMTSKVAAQDNVEVRLPHLQVGFHRVIDIPVTISDYPSSATNPITAAQFRIEFDSGLMTFQDLKVGGTGTEGWFVSLNQTSNGVVRVAMAGTNHAGSGVMFIIRMQVYDTPGFSLIRLTQFSFNEGNPNDVMHNGSVTIGENLPVEWNYFDARADGMAVVLNWGTLDELNNARFDIQALHPGDEQFAVLGSVEGSGTINEPADYSARFEMTIPGEYAFRLKQIDFDGAFDYSETRQVVLINDNTRAFAYPNPFNPKTTVSFMSPVSEDVDVVVYDLIGREKMRHRVTTNALVQHNISIDFAGLATGVYFIHLDGDRIQETLSVVYMR